MKKDKLINKAKILRKEGYSLSEISQKLNISKSTASLWLRNIEITKNGQRRLKWLKQQARRKSRETHSTKKILSLIKTSKDCKVLLKNHYNKDDLKLFFSLLYWCEGGKTERRVIFINSDHEMIKTYLSLFRQSFVLLEDKFRVVLHLHKYHNTDELITFWSKLTKIPKDNFTIYRKDNSGKRKKAGYKGCISIRYGDSKIFDEIFIIIKRFIKEFAGVG